MLFRSPRPRVTVLALEHVHGGHVTRGGRTDADEGALGGAPSIRRRRCGSARGGQDDRLQFGERLESLGSEFPADARLLEPAERAVEVEDHRRVHRHDPGAHLRADLTRWVGARLISRRQGEAILAFERSPHEVPAAPTRPPRRIPVIAEALIQVCAQVMGNHHAITLGGQWGFFELNTMMPMIARNLLESIELLGAGAANFARQCVTGLVATSNGPEAVARGLAICTSLAPEIGYDAAAAIAKEAYKTGGTVAEVAAVRTALGADAIAKLLDPASMVEPGLTGAPMGG